MAPVLGRSKRHGKKVHDDGLALGGGLVDAEVLITRRQLAYLDHIARFPEGRKEISWHGLWLERELVVKSSRRMTLKAQYWQRISTVPCSIGGSGQQ